MCFDSRIIDEINAMIDQTILQNTGLKMVLNKCMTDVDHLLILKISFMYLHDYLASINMIINTVFR